MEALISQFTFSREYLRAALMVSLLSIWVLVGLFYYLNRYTKRDYFTTWTAAWLFYALWLTINLQLGSNRNTGVLFSLGQCSVAASSVFLFWGSLLFLKLQVRQTLLGLFMAFVIVWSLAGPELTTGRLQLELPVFILIGTGSVFAAACFFRFRKKRPFVGAGMLTVGFVLWGLYLGTYPLSRRDESLFSAGFFIAAVIQLFIAVSMVVLVLEEARLISQEATEQIAVINAEKESLQIKAITAEEKCRSLYDQVRTSEGTQKAYEELRETQENIVRQERLRAIGQMTGGLVHDLNNLLTPIKGYSELILASPPALSENQQLMANRINMAANDIANIVRRMRDFYRPRSREDRVESVDVNLAIDEVLAFTRPRWRDLPQQRGACIEISLHLDRTLSPLVGDASELRQALTNLVFNAVDALTNGGIITITTRANTLAPEDLLTAANNAIEIEIRDTGVGMDDDTRRRCLEPFFSTKTPLGGTGLGLAMVYGMVQRQGGEIDIESSLGAGTCVRLKLPAGCANKSHNTAILVRRPDHRTTPLRVLYIDDEPLVRSVVGDSLRSFKHDVLVASSGETALKVFEAAVHSTKPFDAIITDLGMPSMNGMEFARAIKAQSPTTPIIMLSGWGAMTPGERGDKTIDAVLTKPVSLKDLNDALFKVTGGTVVAGTS
jgi:signal transduction histidine kinase/CheY-like chemotaxis protein